VGEGGARWFRSALRSGTFGAEPGGGVGICMRGGGNDAERCGVDGAGAGAEAGRGGGGDEDAVANTLPGANTDSNAIPRPPSPRTLYSVIDGGARTVTKPLSALVDVDTEGRPAFARSHAARLCRVTPSTIAMSDIWPDSAPRPGGGALAYVMGLLFVLWTASELLRPTTLNPGVDGDEGKPAAFALFKGWRAGGALLELRMELCRETLVPEERASFGLALDMARGGVVGGVVADTRDETTDTADAERMCPAVRGGVCTGREISDIERFLTVPLRAP